MNDTSIYIHNISFNDIGVIQCMARNKYGVVVSSAYLNVNGSY